MIGRPPRNAPAPRPARGSARMLAPAVAAAAGLLVACTSSAPTRYHTLTARPPAAGAGTSASATASPPRRAADDGPVLQVAAVRVPPALDREELVRETGPGELQVREFDHWAAPLSRLARQALAEDLAARLPPGRLVFPGASWPAADAVLTVDILAFATGGGVATMLLSWNVRRSSSTPAAGTATTAAPSNLPRGAQLRLETRLDAGTAAQPDDAGATARAWGDLLAQLADRIVADLGDATATSQR